MNTIRTVERRIEEDFTNVGVPTQGNQTPLQDNLAPQGDQASVIPLPMTKQKIRAVFVTLCSCYGYVSTRNLLKLKQ